LIDDLFRLPKAELHLHVEGTLEPELAFALAERNRVALPYASVDEMRRAYAFTSLQSFLDVYYAGMAVLRTEQDFADLANAYLERARRDGVVHVEMFFDPQAHVRRGVPFRTVIDGLWAAVSRSEERFGVSSALIMCFLRDLGPDAAEAALDAALPYGERIVAVGLDSAEVGNPPAPFRRVYERARAAGWRSVAHAGEEGPPSYIREALDVLHVERIDHGVRCLEDAALMARLRDERIPLTVCPLSNVRLRVVDTLADHPLARMLDAGLAATVNSDDPAYFGGYVGDNVARTAEALRLGADALLTLARNSIDASFISAERRAEYRRRLDDAARAAFGTAPH